MKDYQGPRAPRFPKLPSLNNGPASYDCDQATTLSTLIAAKPCSLLGVCVNSAERFPELKKTTPAPAEYKPKTFVEIMDSRITSQRPILSSLEPKSLTERSLRRETNPAPGTYDINWAVGRHVGNDSQFALLKSTRIKNRDLENKRQLSDLKQMLNQPDIFTDKRACRRMAHLALYFPS
ncbi:hypothetical protein HDU78_000268 [Chytriomyces hyalinus]|nr:hypothetical protein HDU78_000268 [Chytriomyces hyalinus]KAJ3254855.1 hypothetical protein HDU77_003917 [Chytriomyces hyalinus]